MSRSKTEVPPIGPAHHPRIDQREKVESQLTSALLDLKNAQRAGDHLEERNAKRRVTRWQGRITALDKA